MSGRPPDIRQQIFARHLDRVLTAAITAQAAGVLSGLGRARELAGRLHLTFSSHLRDRQEIAPGAELARVAGGPVQMARAEEALIGVLSKASGIATAARQAQRAAGPRLRVVAGGVKKMPAQIKGLVRRAIIDGGAEVRMAEQPFVYLDKNYVRILGGIEPALRAAEGLAGNLIIQVRGETAAIAQEALQAARAGATLIMVDTGRVQDLRQVSRALRAKGLRPPVQVAFAGQVALEQLEALSSEDVDAVDIGYAIVDAPCLPLSFDVQQP